MPNAKPDLIDIHLYLPSAVARGLLRLCALHDVAPEVMLGRLVSAALDAQDGSPAPRPDPASGRRMMTRILVTEAERATSRADLDDRLARLGYLVDTGGPVPRLATLGGSALETNPEVHAVLAATLARLDPAGRDTPPATGAANVNDACTSGEPEHD